MSRVVLGSDNISDSDKLNFKKIKWDCHGGANL
jgi:hypothetical protein